MNDRGKSKDELIAELQSLRRQVEEAAAPRRQVEEAAAPRRRPHGIDQERARIARQLHDELGQILTAARMELGTVLAGSEKGATGRIRAVVSLLDEALETMREVVLGLRPRILDLVRTVRRQAEKFRRYSRLHVTLEIDAGGLLPNPDRDAVVIDTLREALTNVMRHASATRVEIRLQVADDRLRLTVRDDGIGIEDAALREPGSLGLIGIRERAFAAAGCVEVGRVPGGRGTMVDLELPL